MTFAEQIEQDLRDAINDGDITVPVVYTPKATGIAKTINAIILPEDANTADENEGHIRISRRQAIILTDATLGIGQPQIDDTITYGDRVWKVLDITSQGFGKAELALLNSQTLVKQHEMHRKQIK